MQTILQAVQSEFSDKGSKFLNFLIPVSDESEIIAELNILKERFPDATHHCYAWRLGPEQLQEYANDDGEPGGTAGLPILNTLKSGDLVNILCVSVRYYGGTKLGKPGLINAYRTAAETCVEKAQTGELKQIAEFEISYPYSEQKHIDQLIHHFKLDILNNTYDASVVTRCIAQFSQKQEITSILESLEYKGISFSITKTGYGISTE